METTPSPLPNLYKSVKEVDEDHYMTKVCTNPTLTRLQTRQRVCTFHPVIEYLLECIATTLKTFEIYTFALEDYSCKQNTDL